MGNIKVMDTPREGAAVWVDWIEKNDYRDRGYHNISFATDTLPPVIKKNSQFESDGSVYHFYSDYEVSVPSSLLEDKWPIYFKANPHNGSVDITATNKLPVWDVEKNGFYFSDGNRALPYKITNRIVPNITQTFEGVIDHFNPENSDIPNSAMDQKIAIWKENLVAIANDEMGRHESPSSSLYFNLFDGFSLDNPTLIEHPMAVKGYYIEDSFRRRGRCCCIGTKGDNLFSIWTDNRRDNDGPNSMWMVKHNENDISQIDDYWTVPDIVAQPGFFEMRGHLPSSMNVDNQGRFLITGRTGERSISFWLKTYDVEKKKVVATSSLPFREMSMTSPGGNSTKQVCAYDGENLISITGNYVVDGLNSGYQQTVNIHIGISAEITSKIRLRPRDSQEETMYGLFFWKDKLVAYQPVDTEVDELPEVKFFVYDSEKIITEMAPEDSLPNNVSNYPNEKLFLRELE